jgi:hypothetical protein
MGGASCVLQMTLVQGDDRNRDNAAMSFLPMKVALS